MGVRVCDRGRKREKKTERQIDRQRGVLVSSSLSVVDG